MRRSDPIPELDRRFSSGGASPTSWAEARELLEEAEIYWLATVRSDGRPHVTPLSAVWIDDALYFCTGPTEQKARNLQGNRHVVLTTGCNRIGAVLDVVVEGDAVREKDAVTLQRIAGAYVSKYGDEWRFIVRDEAFEHDGGTAVVFEVVPRRAYGFRKGEEFSKTHWRFEDRGAAGALLRDDRQTSAHERAR